MNEELIKRLRLKAEVLEGIRDATASLLTQAADALSRPAPAVQTMRGMKVVGYANKAELAKFLSGDDGKYAELGLDHPICWDDEQPYEHLTPVYAGVDGTTFQVHAPAVQVPDGYALVPVEATTAILRPFYECPVDELPLAWSAALAIAKAQNKAAPTPAPVASEAVAQVSRKGIRLEPAELRAMMEWAGIGDGYDKDDAAPLLLWVGEMKDEEGIVTYGLNARNEEVPDEGCWLVKELPRPEVNADKPEQAEDALRSLACWLSVGGYNSEEVDAAEFEKRIREGVETIVRVEVERAKKAVAQGGGVDGRYEILAQLAYTMFDTGFTTGEREKWREQFRALLASPAVPVGDGWMPIETAPKDGTSILLGRLRAGSTLKAADGYWADCWAWPYVLSEPTHWCALPPAPAATKEG